MTKNEERGPDDKEERHEGPFLSLRHLTSLLPSFLSDP